MERSYTGVSHVNHASTPQVVGESQTVRYERPLLADPNTAADMIACFHDGGRTGYHNEYGELRSVSAKDNTVAMRVRRRTANHTANIFEVCDQSNNPFFAVNASGAVVISAAWVAPTFEANAASAGAPKYAVGSRLEPAGVVRLRGQVNLSGSFAADGAIFTLPAAHRPTAQVTFTNRTGGTGAANTFLDVSAAGVLSCRTALNSGAQIMLDGITWAI